VGLLQLLLGSIAGHTQHFVVISFCHSRSNNAWIFLFKHEKATRARRFFRMSRVVASRGSPPATVPGAWVRSPARQAYGCGAGRPQEPELSGYCLLSSFTSSNSASTASSCAPPAWAEPAEPLPGASWPLWASAYIFCAMPCEASVSALVLA